MFLAPPEGVILGAGSQRSALGTGGSHGHPGTFWGIASEYLCTNLSEWERTNRIQLKDSSSHEIKQIWASLHLQHKQGHTVFMRPQTCHFIFLGVNYGGLNWVLRTIWQMQPFCTMLKNRSQLYKMMNNLNRMINSWFKKTCLPTYSFCCNCHITWHTVSQLHWMASASYS